jgi:transcriptional regulator with XRE-family HTH domain
MSSNRVITDRDRENARRLKAFWESKRIQLGLTQKKAADLLGYRTQSMVSQLLSATVALNTDAILKWAQLLQISPSDIDPSMTALGFSKVKLRAVKVAILARMSGEPVNPFESVEIYTQMTRQVYGVSVDVDGFEPLAKKGSTLIISQEEEPISGDEVYIRLQTPSGALQLIKRYVTSDLDRGVAVVHDLYTGDTEELPLDRIELMDPIVGVERPIVNRPIRINTQRSAS